MTWWPRSARRGWRSACVPRATWPFPRGLDLTAYRIVQECLTNVLKHAGAHRVEISLRCLGRCLDIEVTDDGTSAGATSPGGFGLVGMRERVTVYGGTVQPATAKTADSGFTRGCL